MGATAALTLAARHPGRFAAVAVWSGTPAPLWDAQRNVVGLAEDVVTGLADTPVYLWTGLDDEQLDWETLRVFIHGMRAARPDDDTFVWDRGEGGHGYGQKGPARGLRFLKRYKRAPP